MSQELKTLHSYWSVEEAHLARVQLESAGIRAFISDEQMLGMAWHLGNAMQGAKLQVADDDLEQAAQVLEELADEETETAWVEEAGDDVVFDTQQLTADETADDDGVLTNIDSVRRPVIWVLLAPSLATIALAILGVAVALVQLLQR